MHAAPSIPPGLQRPEVERKRLPVQNTPLITQEHELRIHIRGLRESPIHGFGQSRNRREKAAVRKPREGSKAWMAPFELPPATLQRRRNLTNVIVEDIGVRDRHGELRVFEEQEFEWYLAGVGKASGTGFGDEPVVVARPKYGFLEVHPDLSHPPKVFAIGSVHVHGVIRERNSPGKHEISILENAEIPRRRRGRLQPNATLEATGGVEKADARPLIIDRDALIGRAHDHG